MYLLTVIAFAKGSTADELSYFSSEEAAMGDVVVVPLRSRKVPALVLSARPVSDAKSVIRKAGYVLKKVSGSVQKNIISPAAMNAGFRLAEYHAAAPGAVFSSLFAKQMLAVSDTQKEKDAEESVSSGSRLASEKLALVGTRMERIEQYRSLVRSEFARGTSMLIGAPTIAEAEYLYESLRRGIEAYTIMLTASVKEKELMQRIKRVRVEKHPVMIIVTPSFLAVSREDVRLIALEREDAPSWRGISRPFVDYRLFAEYLAGETGARFVLSGGPLSVASWLRLEENDLESLFSTRRRTGVAYKFSLIDVREAKDSARKVFSIFSEHARVSIEEALHEGHRVVLYASRRGMAPTTVCGDCGASVLCEFSGTPMVLHKTSAGRVFMCHACGDVRDSREMCRNCGSWKLVALGIGIERIEEAVRELFPYAPLSIVDRDKQKTHTAVHKAITSFATAGRGRGAILLGTEMMLPYLTEDAAELGVVVSMDSLLSMSSWSAYERAHSILLRLAESSRRVFIQTRMPDSPLITSMGDHDPYAFYKMEIDSRRSLGYPPFSVLIKISVDGSRSGVTETMNRVREHLSPAQLRGSGTPLHLGKNRYRLHSFIRVDSAFWPDDSLVQALRTLSPSVTVHINPESVL